jgi:hypothetical protein
VLNHSGHGGVQGPFASYQNSLALLVPSIRVDLEGERIAKLRTVPHHLPEDRLVLDLHAPVAGLDVRPRVLYCAANEAVDAVELAHRWSPSSRQQNAVRQVVDLLAMAWLGMARTWSIWSPAPEFGTDRRVAPTGRPPPPTRRRAPRPR